MALIYNSRTWWMGNLGVFTYKFEYSVHYNPNTELVEDGRGRWTDR